MLIPLQLTEMAAPTSGAGTTAPMDGGGTSDIPKRAARDDMPGMLEKLAFKEEFARLVSEGRFVTEKPDEAELVADGAPATEIETTEVEDELARGVVEVAEDEDVELPIDEMRGQGREGQGQAHSEAGEIDVKAEVGLASGIGSQEDIEFLTDVDVSESETKTPVDAEKLDVPETVLRESTVSLNEAFVVAIPSNSINREGRDAAALVKAVPPEADAKIIIPSTTSNVRAVEAVPQKAATTHAGTAIQTVAETALTNQLQAFEKAQTSAGEKGAEGARLQMTVPEADSLVPVHNPKRSEGPAQSQVFASAGLVSGQPTQTLPLSQPAFPKTNTEPKKHRVDEKPHREPSASLPRDTLVQSTSTTAPQSLTGVPNVPIPQPVLPPQLGVAMPFVAQQAKEELKGNLDPELAVVSRSSVSLTVAPEPVVQRPEMPRQIVQQLIDAIQRAPDKPVEVRLSPEELGRVRLAIATNEIGVSVMLQVERPETLDLIRRHLDQLAQDFHALGYGEVGFEFAKEGAMEDDQEPLEPQSEGGEIEPQPVVSIEMQQGSTTGLDLRL